MKCVSIILIICLFVGCIPCLAEENSTDLAETNLPVFSIGKIEAEDMALDGYDKVENEYASGGEIIECGVSNDIFKSASFRYSGESGKYSIVICYADLYYGASTRKLLINGEQISIWTGSKAPGVASWSGGKFTPEKNHFRTKVISNVQLNKDDIVTLVGKGDYRENGQFDYLVISKEEISSQTENVVFTDVRDTCNGKKDIYELEQLGVITGDGDRRFRPEDSIKVSEWIKMLAVILGYCKTTDTLDVALSVAEAYGLCENGVIAAPNSIVTVEKAKKFLTNAGCDTKELFDDCSCDKQVLSRADSAILLNKFRKIMDKTYGFSEPETETPLYDCDADGFVKTWATTGMAVDHVTTYTMEVKQNDLKGFEPDFAIPDNENFSQTLPNGMEFIPKSLGSNVFASEVCRGGESTRTANQLYYVFDLIANEDVKVNAVLHYRVGLYTVWCNGEKVAEQIWSYNPMQLTPMVLNLKKGVNRIFISVREKVALASLNGVGFQILNNRDKIKTTIPLDKTLVKNFYSGYEWLSSLKMTEDGNMIATATPSADVTVVIGTNQYRWPKYEKLFDFSRFGIDNPINISVLMDYGQCGMARNIELIKNVEFVRSGQTDIEAHRKEYIQKLYKKGNTGDFADVSRVTLKCYLDYELDATDEEDILSYCNIIDTIKDCGDFRVVNLLRLYMLYKDELKPEICEVIKKTLLNFWFDLEIGSENYESLNYSSLYLTANLWPDEMFGKRGKKGKELISEAESALDNFYTKLETYGFLEFQSSCYMTRTLSGIFNIYDFSNDAELKARAGKLLDLCYRYIAANSYGGICVGAMGRVYREVINVTQTGKQAFLSYVSPSSVQHYDLWQIFPITSQYEIPGDFEELVNGNVNVNFAQGGCDLVINKTKDYLLSGTNVPRLSYLPTNAEVDAYAPQKGETTKQHHLWDASIGTDCRTFVTHPGSSMDAQGQRPDYWYGEGSTPAIKQIGNMIAEVYNISEDDPIGFTHAYWTGDNFDEQKIEKNWLFARKENGYLALWCSSELIPHDDLLIDREYRAMGKKTAWICVASSKDESGSFEEFINSTKQKNPSFSIEDLVLMYDGKEILRY